MTRTNDLQEPDAPQHGVLLTGRLLLRPLVSADAADLHLALRDPEVTRYLDLPTSPDLVETARLLVAWLYVLPDWHATWAILRRDEPGVIGIVNYHHRDIWNERLEIGYIVARAYWRQGFAQEAVRALIEHCFTKMNTHRIEATIEPGNFAAQALARKLGFAQESGILRHRRKIGDTYRDAIMFGLLKPEWNNR
jgi:ribosomal-protein-alanine N-acetyltransferase